MRQRVLILFAAIAIAVGMLLPEPAPAQFTNSATLSASVQGTNLVISYSLTTTQGWVTLFSADRPDQFATKAEPVDLAQAPPTRSGQFNVPIDPSTSPKFLRLLIEPWPSRGRVLVFTNGPCNFAAMKAAYGSITNYGSNTTPVILNQPVEVWVDNLGAYNSETGDFTNGNNGLLTGKYAATHITPINFPSGGWFPVPDLYSVSNDFRVNYAGDDTNSRRAKLVWACQAQAYHDINRYRDLYLNDQFIHDLHLPVELENNLLCRQFRPDLDMGQPPHQTKTLLEIYETQDPTKLFIDLLPINNWESLGTYTPGLAGPLLSDAPGSMALDSGCMVSDYAGLAAFYVLGTPKGFPTAAGYGGGPSWTTNVLPPINDGLSQWVAYRVYGNQEVMSYANYIIRIYNHAPCGGTGVPCEKGNCNRNVMMYDIGVTTKDGIFPFSEPGSMPAYVGLAGSPLAAMYFGAIFYDIANEAGLGLRKADLLFWKTISLITTNQGFTMTQFGATVMSAAQALWSDGRYQNDIARVLSSRGIPLGGQSDFRNNVCGSELCIPAAIGPVTTPSANLFGSGIPESHPSVGSYGGSLFFSNGYTRSGSPNYVAYQFYKHSKYGPCDYLELTDGTFDASGYYNNDGTWYWKGKDRDLGNLILLAPGSTIRWNRNRVRCPNEGPQPDGSSGYFAEDVRPFGFRVINAISNGFSFTVSLASEDASNRTYNLTIVDPSLASIGAATYAWFVTHSSGASDAPRSGTSVQITVEKDEPFTLQISRTRGVIVVTITLRERGNDLDRNGGTAFVRSFVPGTIIASIPGQTAMLQPEAVPKPGSSNNRD